MTTDPFEEVFNLEDQFFREGYKQGYDDGAKAGRVEGRSFGLEKGFEKFVEAGRLQGRAGVWGSRLEKSKPKETSSDAVSDSWTADIPRLGKLPQLPRNAKLEKNITSMYSLVEPDTLSTENTDEAVADFDDRLRRAQGRARVIAKAIGEPTEPFNAREAADRSRRGDGSIEDNALRQAYGAKAA